MPYEVLGPKSMRADRTSASVVDQVTMPTVGIFELRLDVTVNVHETEPAVPAPPVGETAPPTPPAPADPTLPPVAAAPPPAVPVPPPPPPPQPAVSATATNHAPAARRG